MKKEVLILVKIIAVLLLILAALNILGGITDIILDSGGEVPIIFWYIGLLQFVLNLPFTLLGKFFYLALGVFLIFMAIGLWKRKNWARIVCIMYFSILVISYIWLILSELHVTPPFISRLNNILIILVSSLIVGYLFSRKVKETFRSK